MFPSPGEGRIELTVVDPSGNSATSVREVSVIDATPPNIIVSLPGRIEQGQEFLIDITGSGDNVGLVSVHFIISRNTSGELVEFMSTPFFGIRIGNVSPSEYGEVEELRIVLDEPGPYVIDVRVEDGAGLSSPMERIPFKVWDNVPPRARLNISLVVINPGMTVHLSASESTDEVGPLSFTWYVDGEELPQEGSILSWTPPALGEYNVTVRVMDGDGNTDHASTLVQVIEAAKEIDEGDPYFWIYVLWSAVIVVIVMGTAAIYLWARRRRREIAKGQEE
jgi:hypothetical protein